MTAGSEYKGAMGQESSLRFLEESSRNFGESGSSVLQKPTDRGLPTGCSKRMGDRSGTVPIAEEHPGCLCPPLWWTRISRQLAQMPGPRWLWWTLALAAIIGWGFADIRLRGLRMGICGYPAPGSAVARSPVRTQNRFYRLYRCGPGLLHRPKPL